MLLCTDLNDMFMILIFARVLGRLELYAFTQLTPQCAYQFVNHWLKKNNFSPEIVSAKELIASSYQEYICPFIE